MTFETLCFQHDLDQRVNREKRRKDNKAGKWENKVLDLQAKLQQNESVITMLKQQIAEYQEQEVQSSNLTTLKYFFNKQWKPKDSNQFKLIINVLVPLPDSFKYRCYGSTIFINMFTLTVRGWTLGRRI